MKDPRSSSGRCGPVSEAINAAPGRAKSSGELRRLRVPEKEELAESQRLFCLCLFLLFIGMEPPSWEALDLSAKLRERPGLSRFSSCSSADGNVQGPPPPRPTPPLPSRSRNTLRRIVQAGSDVGGEESARIPPTRSLGGVKFFKLLKVGLSLNQRFVGEIYVQQLRHTRVAFGRLTLTLSCERFAARL